MNSTVSNIGRWTRAGAAAVIGALALAACGASGAAAGGSNTGTSDQAAVQALATLYRGTYTAPKGPVLAGLPRSKTIWVIPAGLSAGVFDDVASGVKAAAATLGWKVVVFDGQFSQTTQLQGVEQAIAAGASGIITYSVDCSSIKNGLIQARAAHIPVINSTGAECSPGAFAATVQYPGYPDYLSYIRGYGAAQANYVIAKSGGKAKVLVANETDLGSTQAEAAGTLQALASCSGCQVVGQIKFVAADFGPSLQSKISQALLQHPQATAFIAPYDAVLTAGGAQALRASGRASQILTVGGECSAPVLAMISSGSGASACIGYDASAEGWGAMNYLANLFAGKSVAGMNDGVGFEAVDRSHNMPASGKPFTPPIDFPAAYAHLWGLS